MTNGTGNAFELSDYTEFRFFGFVKLLLSNSVCNVGLTRREYGACDTDSN
nr:MAG TPA: Spheroplast protein Y, Colicin-E7 immunity [Caudoviricetes sp.]